MVVLLALFLPHDQRQLFSELEDLLLLLLLCMCGSFCKPVHLVRLTPLELTIKLQWNPHLIQAAARFNGLVLSNNATTVTSVVAYPPKQSSSLY